MSDFLRAIADQFDNDPSCCECGHPDAQHGYVFGCMARGDDCPCALGPSHPFDALPSSLEAMEDAVDGLTCARCPLPMEHHPDNEPDCRCTSTARGDDTLGCPRHDPDYPESVPDEAAAMAEPSVPATGDFDLTQDQLRSLIAEQAAQIGLTFDEAVELGSYGELPKGQREFHVAMLVRMLTDTAPPSGSRATGHGGE